MKILTSVLLFIAIVSQKYLVVYSNDIRLNAHDRSKRMSGGVEAALEKFPYVVFLKTKVSSNEFYKNTCNEKLCTGTLIHARLVLTQLNCVMKTKLRVGIKAGSETVDPQSVKVNKINYFYIYLIFIW